MAGSCEARYSGLMRGTTRRAPARCGTASSCAARRFWCSSVVTYELELRRPPLAMVVEGRSPASYALDSVLTSAPSVSGIGIHTVTSGAHGKYRGLVDCMACRWRGRAGSCLQKIANITGAEVVI